MYEAAHDDFRKLILHAAGNVIRQFGFEKTTMNDIAKAIRKGKSSLYHYFTNKEQIFEEVLRSEIAELKVEFMKVIEAEPAPESKIRAYVLNRMEMFRKLARRHMSFIERTAERYDLLLKIHEEYDQEEIRIISEIFTQGVAEGLFVIRDIPTTAATFVTALKAFEYPFSKLSNPARTGRELGSLLEMLFSGILAR
jgi:AcrR family transcriptional regulator